MYASNVSSNITTSFSDLWIRVSNFLPELIIAILIVIVGWALGVLFCRAISEVIHVLKIDEVFHRAGVGRFLHRAGIRLDSGLFLGTIVKWFVIFGSLVAAFGVLGLPEFKEFVLDIFRYLPQVIIAILILMAAGLIGEVLQKAVHSSALAAGISVAGFLSAATKWAVWIFAILIALAQLGIAQVFIQTLFTGLVVALSLAFGLAFGLGGQHAASRVIDRVEKEIADRK